MNLSTKCALVVAAAAVLGSTTAEAQNTDTDQINVTAQVQTALDVAAGQDLDLGAAFPGTTRTVAASDAASGEFVITGGNGGGLDITFVLPANLTDGVNNLPVTFTAAAGADRGSAAGFDPSALHQDQLDGTTGQLNVYLGASVVVPALQPSGTYSGTVQMTATYNGL